MEWYPSDPEKLKETIENYLSQAEEDEKIREIKSKINKHKKEIHGLVVPHAGYEFSGSVAAKAYSLIKDKDYKKAIIIAPSHYSIFKGIDSIHEIKTPLGKMPI